LTLEACRSLTQFLALRIWTAILIENIELAAGARTLLIDRTAIPLFPRVSESYARCTALFRTLHAGQMVCKLASEICWNDAYTVALNLSVIKTHSEMLTTLATFKTRIHCHNQTQMKKKYTNPIKC
jgi:hypothetical protein